MPPSTGQVRAKLPAPHHSAHAQPLLHANNTRKFTEMQTQLATTYVPTLHCSASELRSEKNANTKNSNTFLASKGTVKCKQFAWGSHMTGALQCQLSTKHANTKFVNSCKQEDCSKNRPSFSFLGGHISGAPLPEFK